MDQAKPQSENILGNLKKCCSHPDMDCTLRLPPFVIFEIQSKTWFIPLGILRVLQLNLFERRSLFELLKPPDKTKLPVSPQLLLWNQL